MVLTLLGILISASCASASLRRLWFVAETTALDPAELARAVDAQGRGERGEPNERFEREPSIAALRGALDAKPSADWERDLLDALGARGAARIALVNEQLAELDYRAQRWSRVPRVCASISSSTGFLLAALAMRAGLAGDDVDLDEAMMTAINVVTIGIAGTAFCIATHVRARAMVRSRLAAADKLVERLEAWMRAFNEGKVGPEPVAEALADPEAPARAFGGAASLPSAAPASSPRILRVGSE